MYFIVKERMQSLQTKNKGQIEGQTESIEGQLAAVSFLLNEILCNRRHLKAYCNSKVLVRSIPAPLEIPI